jgi:drug/metabolite transporter (DMT)-like permease
MTSSRVGAEPATWKIVAAFAAVYLIWGSTYLAIRFMVEALPPFVMAGLRFLIAGGLLYAWARFQGAARPSAVHWRTTLIIGGLLLLGGNGGVVWAEKHVPSGLTALIVATVSLWIVLIDWQRQGGVRPTGRVVLGVFLGLLGVGILVGPSQFAGAQRIDPVGAGVLVLAALSWAIGSVYSRHVRIPESSLLTTAMEMLGGGVCLMVFGTIVGDWSALSLSAVTPKSIMSLAYLIVFGSLIGFTAYMWLLKVTTPARAATYAYVNPIVAVILGWLLADEAMSARTIIAAAVIVTGVVFITRGGQRPSGAHLRAIETKPAGEVTTTPAEFDARRMIEGDVSAVQQKTYERTCATSN